MSVHAHRGRKRHPVGCAILTVSDTRTEETDGSGRRIRELLEADGRIVQRYEIVADEAELIRKGVHELVEDPDVGAVFLNGGTGISPRDRTFEAVQSLLDIEIEGFGEIFRALSFEEIGSAAMLSRATAGVAAKTIIVAMPGSTGAVELAMTRLVLPELDHMVNLLAGKT